MAPHEKTPDRYKYEILPVHPATIRLLKVFPSARSPITCSLQSFTLSEAPCFHALSYTWGDPLDQRLSSPDNHRVVSKELDKYVITEDGSIIGATENLIDALYALSTRKENDQDQPYWWVDALCINQNDIDEKGVQVAMMDKVYDKAEKVLIWLGKEDEHTPSAIRILNGLADPDANVTAVSQRSWDSEGYAAFDELVAASELLGLDDVEVKDWIDYAQFLQRNWFSRIWVVQEKFFARETEILCGPHVIPWTTIMKSSEVLIRTRMNILLKSLVDQYIAGDAYDINVAATHLPNNRLDNQQIFSMVSKGNMQSIGLDKLLFCTKTFDATNDKDKIFAIKGVWEEGQPVSGGQPSIQTDYHRSIEDVYSDATVLAIRESQRLDILGLVEDPLSRERTDLATWIPDFSAGPKMYPLVLALQQSVVSANWHASQGISFKAPERINGNELAVDGVEIDEIVQVGPTYIEVMNEYQLGLLLQVLADNPQKQYRSKFCGDAFLRTLIKNTYAGEPVVGNESEAYAAFQAFVMKRVQEFETRINVEAFSQQLEDLKHELDKLSSRFLLVPSAEETEQLIITAMDEGSAEEIELEGKRKGMEESFRVAYLGRRMFSTKQGYFGITSESVGIGDTVWIVVGGKTPYVLRKNKSETKKSRVVGEAYVEGLMQGEAISGGSRIESIILM